MVLMDSLQLHQALVDAGMPGSGTGTAKAFLENLCHRLGLSTSGSLKQQFFGLLTHLLASAPALASSWLADYVAFSTTLSSSDPEEAHILQPLSVLAWCQSTTAELQQRLEAFLRSGPAAGVDAVLELQQTAQSLLAVATALQAVCSSSALEVKSVLDTLQQLQQATKVLQVLEQLQQQQLASPARTNAYGKTGNMPGGLHPTDSSTGFGQQPMFRPNNAACSEWQQQLTQRRAASADGRLFLDDLLQALQQQARLQDNSLASSYPYSGVLGCVHVLFAASGSSSTSGAWLAKLAVLLYYLLDGGWLCDAEAFAQGFQMPLTTVQQWQCYYLLDAAADSSRSSKTGSSKGAGDSSAALDKACTLLEAIACPSTPFRFVEALLQAGRPATALAVQRARCAGGSSSAASLNEAEVLLRVQLGCGLLAEAFCDLSKHCNQVLETQRAQHTNTLVRQLTDWALAPTAAADVHAAAAAAAEHLQQQLQLQEGDPAVAAAAGLPGSSGVRQQQLLQLPLNAGEEAVLVAVLRERMAAGKPGGHLLPLYLLQRGRVLEALNSYTDYKASPAAASTTTAAPATAAEAAAGRALLHKRLDAIMAAAAAALPPALRVAAAAAGGGGGGLTRQVLQGLGGMEARRLQGGQAGVVLLQPRGVEPAYFLAPLVPASSSGSYQAAAGSAGAGAAATPAIGAHGAQARQGGVSAGLLGRSGGSRGAAGAGSSRQQARATVRKDTALRPLLFEAEALAAAGPGTVKVGVKDTPGGRVAEVVPLLFGTPAPAATAAAAAAAAASTVGKAPGVVRGGLFDTPVGGGAAPWANSPAAGWAAGADMSEADFEREVRFGTPHPRAAAAAAAGSGAGVFQYTGQRSHKRMRKTPL